MLIVTLLQMMYNYYAQGVFQREEVGYLAVFNSV